MNGGRNYKPDRCSYVIKIRPYAGKPEYPTLPAVNTSVTMWWVQVISREGQATNLEPSETVRRTPRFAEMIQSDLCGDTQSG